MDVDRSVVWPVVWNRAGEEKYWFVAIINRENMMNMFLFEANFCFHKEAEGVQKSAIGGLTIGLTEIRSCRRLSLKFILSCGLPLIPNHLVINSTSTSIPSPIE